MRELSKQQDTLTKKIQRLRERLAYENDTATQFKLENQIEESETELADLKQRNTSQNLYTCLLRLGYHDQEMAFKRFIYEESVAAFLIHICPDPGNGCYYGQHWLVNRLKSRVLGGIAGKKVKIDLNRVGRSKDVKALWRELSHHAGLRPDSKPDKIALQFYQFWQTQNIFLFLDSIDEMPEPYMQELLQEFWSPLITQIQQNQGSTSSSKLLMFLIDNSGSVEQWNIQFVDRLNPLWRSEIPVKLPRIQKFSNEVLTNQIHSDFHLLHHFPDDDAIKMAVQNILNGSEGGIPQWVFHQIQRISA